MGSQVTTRTLLGKQNKARAAISRGFSEQLDYLDFTGCHYLPPSLLWEQSAERQLQCLSQDFPFQRLSVRASLFHLHVLIDLNYPPAEVLGTLDLFKETAFWALKQRLNG